jgi:RNA polymerase sigma factor (sigma-70 family)
MQAAPNRTVAALPPRQRASLVLRYYHDYSYAAVGEALGITEGAAGALLSRALDRLRDELDRSAGTIRP